MNSLIKNLAILIIVVSVFNQNINAFVCNMLLNTKQSKKATKSQDFDLITLTREELQQVRDPDNLLLERDLVFEKEDVLRSLDELVESAGKVLKASSKEGVDYQGVKQYLAKFYDSLLLFTSHSKVLTRDILKKGDRLWTESLDKSLDEFEAGLLIIKANHGNQALATLSKVISWEFWQYNPPALFSLLRAMDTPSKKEFIEFTLRNELAATKKADLKPYIYSLFVLEVDLAFWRANPKLFEKAFLVSEGVRNPYYRNIDAESSKDFIRLAFNTSASTRKKLLKDLGGLKLAPEKVALFLDFVSGELSLKILVETMSPLEWSENMSYVLFYNEIYKYLLKKKKGFFYRFSSEQRELRKLIRIHLENYPEVLEFIENFDHIDVR